METLLDFSMILTWQFWVTAVLCGAVAAVMKGVPKIPSWLIPIVILVVGAIVHPAISGAWEPLFFVAGVIAASVECFVYELFKSTIGGITQSYKAPTPKETITEEKKGN